LADEERRSHCWCGVLAPAAGQGGADACSWPLHPCVTSRALPVVRRAVSECRPVFVAGVDGLSRHLATLLRAHGVIVTAFVDPGPHALGATLDGLPIQPVASLSPVDPRHPFIAVAGPAATDIDIELASTGWIRDENYVVL